MTLLDRYGEPLSSFETKSTQPGFFGLDWLVTPTSSGVTVTANNAIKCAVVAVCVTLLTGGMSIPVKCYRRENGAKSVATDHPAHSLVHADANDWQTAAQFRALLQRDALLHGNGFAFVNRDGSGRPVELLRLHPSAASIEVDAFSGEPRYRISLANGGQRVESYRDVLHVTSGVHGDDGITGISLVHIGRDDIGTALVMAQTIASTFKNNSRPGGVLSFKKALPEEALSRIRAAWTEGFGGSNTGRTAVLDNEAEYVVVQQPLAENEAEKLLIQANVAICRHFNVPPSLAFEMSRATWSNLAEQNRHFVDYSLAPLHREWTAAYRRTLLADDERNDYTFEFETDEFVKSDTVARWQAYQSAISSGVLTANEVRAIENMPRHPSPEADLLRNPFTTSANAAPPAAPSPEGSEDE